jgi:hypothetical protein
MRVPQARVLRRDAGGAGVEVADAQVLAAERDHGRGAEAEALGAEQRRLHHVEAGLEAAIDLEPDLVAQAIAHQHLLRLASPSSQGEPAYLIEDWGEAPVPPS